MFSFLRLLAAFVGVVSFVASAPLFARDGFVQEAAGSVTAQVGTGQPVKVTKGQILVSNATITTAPRSFAVLKFADGTNVLLKENTSFQIQNYTYNAKSPENANVLFNLIRGGLRMVTGLVTSRNRDSLKVATPLATIGIRGTEFVAELTNPLYIQVINGVISVTNAAGTVLFSTGQVGVVSSTTTLGALIPIGQVPAGVLAMPNFPLTPFAPGTIPPGTPIGGGVLGGGVGAAVAVGIGIAAGVAIMNDDSSGTTTQHAK